MKLRIKLGDLEFEAEGSREEVEKQLNYFISNILPAWAEAMKEARG